MLSLKLQILHTGNNMKLNTAYEQQIKHKNGSDLKEAQGCTLPMLITPNSLNSGIF